MRPAELLVILEREFLSARDRQHTPVMLWGPPGVGKSQMVAQVAAKHATAVIDIRLSQMEPSDLRGIPFRLDNIVEWAVPALLPDGAPGRVFAASTVVWVGAIFPDDFTGRTMQPAAAISAITDSKVNAQYNFILIVLPLYK